MASDDKIVEQVAARMRAEMDARFIADQLAQASAEVKEQLANDLARFFVDQQRSGVTTYGKQAFTTRYLWEGEEVTEDADGTVVGLTGGKGQFDIVGIHGGAAWIDSADNARQINFRVGGGGADCMFDYLVSECWADEVAAGRGIEGQVMTSITGCPFIVYSTIQAALTAAGALSANDSSTIFVCAGEYDEQLSTDSVNNGSLILIGAGQGNTRIKYTGGAGGETMVDLATQVNGENAIIIDGFTFNATLMNGSGNTLLAGGGSTRVKLSRCHFIDGSATDVSINLGNSSVGGWTMTSCNFSGTGIAISMSNSLALPESTVLGCVFEPGHAIDIRFRGGSVLNVESCYLYGDIGVDVSGNAAPEQLVVSGCFFMDCDTGIKHGTSSAPSDTFTYNNNNFYSCSIGIDFDAVTAGVDGVVINGNNFNVVSTEIGIRGDATHLTNSIISDNNFSGYDPGNEFTGMTLAQLIANGVQLCHNSTDSGTPLPDSGRGHVGTGTGMAAPNDADYLVGTANSGLTNEIVVGTTPGGELGGTWASPTVDATHAGSTHDAATNTHIADTTDAHDASAISIVDAGAYFTGTDVEAALQELGAGGGGSGHTIHDETGAALTTRAALHFMGSGVFAQDNGGSTRTEVVVGTVYDAIVDSADTNAAGKGNVYSTLQAAIAAGHNSILFRSSTDGSDITIGSGDGVTRIVGDSSTTAVMPVNITCQKTGVLFDSLTFSSKKLTLEATQCRAFACIFAGTIGNPTALLNGALSESGTSMPFDGGTNGGLASAINVRIDNEYMTVVSGGAAVSGTATVYRTWHTAFTASWPHADNATITDIGVGHLEIKAADCEITACFWIACSNSDAQCVYISAAGSRARITACSFLSNTTFACIGLQANSSNQPELVEVVGTKFSGNATKQAVIQTLDKANNASSGHIHALKVNGCSFSGMDYGAIKCIGVRFNIAGNTFTSGNSGPSSRTNLVDLSGGLSGTTAADKSIPFDTDGGSVGTRPQMGLVEIGSELVTYAARKTGTTSGTATATSATTLTDGGAAWSTDQWYQQVIVAGTSWGIVVSNTATVITVDSWRGGTPSSTAAYAVRASLVGCSRGMLGTTAAAPADNATITYISEQAICFIGSNVVAAAQANIVSGNTFVGVRTGYLCHTYTGGISLSAPAALFSGNSLTSVTRLFGHNNFVFATNQNTPSMAMDGRSGTGQVYVASQGPMAFSNIAADAVFFSPTVPSGVPTAYRLTDGKKLQMGAAAGNLAPICIPMTNKTGANSVTGNIAAIRNATSDSSFVDNPGAASNRVCGVQQETGVADGSDCLVAVAGVVQVLCTTAAVARGDLLATSATAGQAATAAGGHGTILGKALEAKGAGSTGLVRCLITLS